MGRKKVYLYTLLIMIFCTVAQALSASTISGAPRLLHCRPCRAVPLPACRRAHPPPARSVHSGQTEPTGRLLTAFFE